MPLNVIGASRVAAAVFLAALAALLAPSHSVSQGAGTEEIHAETVRYTYESLRDATYNSEPLKTLELLYEQALDSLNRAELPPRTKALLGSRIEFLLARGYQAAGKKPQAASHYEEGLAYIERVPECEVFSEGWQMRSEHIGQLCLVKGLGFLLANGRKVVGCAAQALELDPANAAAQIIVAASKVYPPALFGGNPAIGIELMQKALAMGTAERDDLFNIYSGIGLAYGKLKNIEEARCWLEKALELYPGNLFVRGEYKKLVNQDRR
jgi:tetratricopeptide (TPR) repeat protein